MSPFCSARKGEGENALSPRRSALLSQPPASSTSTAPQHHDHTRTAGKEWSGEMPSRSSSTAAGATTAVKVSPETVAVATTREFHFYRPSTPRSHTHGRKGMVRGAAVQIIVDCCRCHDCRESFAGDRRCCELPPQPTLAVVLRSPEGEKDFSHDANEPLPAMPLLTAAAVNEEELVTGRELVAVNPTSDIGGDFMDVLMNDQATCGKNVEESHEIHHEGQMEVEQIGTNLVDINIEAEGGGHGIVRGVENVHAVEVEVNLSENDVENDGGNNLVDEANLGINDVVDKTNQGV
nr:hypothetical protein Iba_chr09dCG13720 [Ipomoea batatas]